MHAELHISCSGGVYCRTPPTDSVLSELTELMRAIKLNGSKYSVSGQSKQAGVLGHYPNGGDRFICGRWEQLSLFLGGISN